MQDIIQSDIPVTHCIEPRDDEVQAKGKGKLQTYWSFMEKRNETDDDIVLKFDLLFMLLNCL